MDRNELLQQKIQQKTYEQRNYSNREIFNEDQSHHETNSQHMSSRKHWSGANSSKLLHDLKTKRKSDRVTRNNKGANNSDIVAIEIHSPKSPKDFIMEQEVVAKAKHRRQPTMTQSQTEILLSNLDPGDAGLSPNQNQSLDLTSQKSCDDGETSLNKGFPFKADKNND